MFYHASLSLLFYKVHTFSKSLVLNEKIIGNVSDM